MRVATALRAAGATHPGHYREVNEDRFHVDLDRGIFLVVDGVGGQAAGGKAADTAVSIVRARLERETGPPPDRVREAITAANNEIHRLASLRPEWAGMACVLTVAVVHDGRAVIGHVGDTRLYKIRDERIEKVTRDHSPVGEREDAGELSELEAMRNPRRNEVYRDVGSDRHEPNDADFIDVLQIPFETDAALLLCSDGLTDLVPSASIHRIVAEMAGRPEAVVRALVAAANDAGGKDNVTAVYVEGDEFSPERTRPLPERRAPDVVPVRRWRGRAVRIAILTLLLTVLGATLARQRIVWPTIGTPQLTARTLLNGTLVVTPSDSIMAAVNRASPGERVVVEPGEYRERLRLKDGVRLVSRDPRRAIIRLPSDASEREPAIVADRVSGAELDGFRIVGDSATPLGVGLWIRNASVAVKDVEITGAARAAIDVDGSSAGSIVGSEIHGNPGAALRIGAGATIRIAHNSFVRNGSASGAQPSFFVAPGARPQLTRNTFHGIGPAAFSTLDDSARAALASDNWFVAPPSPPTRVPQRIGSGPAATRSGAPRGERNR